MMNSLFECRCRFYFCFIALCVGVPASGLVIMEDLSGESLFQDEHAELPPSQPGTGVDTQLHTVTIGGISAGGNSYDIDFLFGNSWGSSGLIERYIDMRSTAGSIELAFAANAPDVVVAYGTGQVVDEGLTWYDSGSKDIIMVRYLDILGSETNQGQFQDGAEHYAAFRLVDDTDYYYGYVELTISDYPDHPTLSISGYAFESTPNTALTTTEIIAVPEGSHLALVMGLIALLGIIRRQQIGLLSYGVNEE